MILQNKGQKTGSWKQLTIAKHQSIWQKSWKPKRSGSKQTSLLETMSQPMPKRPKTSLPKPFIESDVDDAASELQEAKYCEDLLNEYRKECDPPPKKFDADIDDDMDAENETESRHNDCLSPKAGSSSRNPFKKQSIVMSHFQSPTKITPENSSLIKNQSPIKQIDYRRLEKLSRFSRTTIPDKQNVISRFFTEPQDNAANSVEVKLVASDDPKIVQIERKAEEFNELKQEPKVDGKAQMLYHNTSGDSAISLGVENGSQNIHDTANVGGGDTNCIDNKTDSNSNDNVIVISETEDTSEEGFSSQPKIEPKKTQPRNGNVSIAMSCCLTRYIE